MELLWSGWPEKISEDVTFELREGGYEVARTENFGLKKPKGKDPKAKKKLGIIQETTRAMGVGNEENW